MEIEGGIDFQKHQDKKKASVFSATGINFDEIGKQSPVSLSPRGSPVAALGEHGQGGNRSAKSVRCKNCLCSPTTHAGSFRCRFHRNYSMPRLSSVGSNLSDLATKPGTPISSCTHAQ